MITDLERQFFKTFGIEPRSECCKTSCPYYIGKSVKDPSEKVRACEECTQKVLVYPEITDRILLSLVKIACKENIISLTRMKNGSKEWAVYFGLNKNSIFYEKSFKDVILKGFIEYSNDRDLYTRVQALFKGVNNENKNIN